MKTRHFLLVGISACILSFAAFSNFNLKTSKVNAAGETAVLDNYYAIIDNSADLLEKYPTNWTYQTDTSVAFNDVLNMTWTISSGRRSSSNKLELGQIESAAAAAAATITANLDPESDWFKIAAAMGYSGDTSKFVSVVASDGYISNIQDFHFYFGACEAGFVTVLYQEQGSDVWTVVKTDDGEKSYFASDASNTQGSGISGSWNRSAYHNGTSWQFTTTLQGKTARIAFAYEAYYYASNYLTLHGICINTLNSAKHYIERLSSEDGICEKITNDTNNYKTTLELINYRISNDDLTNLSSLELTSEKTGERTYYAFYSYLLTYAGVANSDPLGLNSANIYLNNNELFIIVVTMCLAIAIVSTIVLVRKRKLHK